MTDTKQTIIFLIRHGKTDHAYSTDPSVDNERQLTEEGSQQLEKVGEYLAAFAPVAIYSSPRKRTLQSAEIIKEQAHIDSAVQSAQELFEIYSPSDYQSLEKRIPNFFAQLVAKHSGRHIVCVSHQDTIQGGLDAYDLTDEEKDFPCEMAELYRLVFAGPTLVECQKLRPAA